MNGGYPPGCKDDPADAPRCPMEALAGRMITRKAPYRVEVSCFYNWDRSVSYWLNGEITSPEQLDDLINFLQEVRG